MPECPKIYVGSFWDQQLKHDLYRRLFEKELQSLFDDLQDLPRSEGATRQDNRMKLSFKLKLNLPN